MKSLQFTSVGRYEVADSEGWWCCRPNQRAAHRTAYFHAGCLTLFVAWIIILPAAVAVLGSVVLLREVLHQDVLVGVAVLAGVFSGISVCWMIWLFARFIVSKSLRDNWLTMRASRDGALWLGAKELLTSGQARQVLVASTIVSGEGSDSLEFHLEIELQQSSAAPVLVPIPHAGLWQDSVSSQQEAHDFARVLAASLGVAGPAGDDSKTA